MKTSIEHDAVSHRETISNMDVCPFCGAFRHEHRPSYGLCKYSSYIDSLALEVATKLLPTANTRERAIAQCAIEKAMYDSQRLVRQQASQEKEKPSASPTHADTERETIKERHRRE